MAWYPTTNRFNVACDKDGNFMYDKDGSLLEKNVGRYWCEVFAIEWFSWGWIIFSGPVQDNRKKNNLFEGRQTGKATDFDSVICRFESYPSNQLKE